MSQALRLRAIAAALTLASGAVMSFAGYVGETESWGIAGFVAIPGGVLIFAALAFARAAEHRRPGVDPRVMAVTLASGAVMVFAGYAGSAWGWGLTAPLAAIGGVVIGGAFALDRPARPG